MTKKYVVVRTFEEKKHNGHVYTPKNEYPAKGYKTTDERIEQLSTNKNKYGHAFIAEVAEEVPEEAKDNKEKKEEEAPEETEVNKEKKEEKPKTKEKKTKKDEKK